MKKVELAKIILDSIKDKVNVFDVKDMSIVYDINMNPTIPIMEDGKLKFTINIVEVS